MFSKKIIHIIINNHISFDLLKSNQTTCLTTLLRAFHSTQKKYILIGPIDYA
jgi:hypothetical protein